MNPRQTVAQIEERLRRAQVDPLAFTQHARSDVAFLLTLIPPELRAPAPLKEVRTTGRLQDMIEQRDDGWYIRTAPRTDN